MAKSNLHPGQGTLQAEVTVDRLNHTQGVVRIEDLDYQVFDADIPLTMREYLGQLGSRISATARESQTTDEALEVFGKDFSQSSPVNLRRALYYKAKVEGKWLTPRKSFARIGYWYHGLSKEDYPGLVPFTTDVAVNEAIYEALIGKGDYYSNAIDNRTQKKQLGKLNAEERANRAGESVVYAYSGKHEKLEEIAADLDAQYIGLLAVNRSVTISSDMARSVDRLEEYRYRADVAIHEMVRVACKAEGYGENQTRATQRAVTSNMTRSADPAGWLARYTELAMDYNDAVTGKVVQAIFGCIDQIGRHREQVINNLDRIYKDPPKRKRTAAKAA